MSLAEFDSLTATVLVAILLLAAMLGFVMRETRFCTVGAISDVVYLQDWGRARQWCMAIAVSMLGFTAMALWGQLQVGDALYASRRLLWLSALAGGLLFGAGMVLASGCGARNLTRLGSGSLKAVPVAGHQAAALLILDHQRLGGVPARQVCLGKARVGNDFDVRRDVQCVQRADRVRRGTVVLPVGTHGLLSVPDAVLQNVAAVADKDLVCVAHRSAPFKNTLKQRIICFFCNKV